MINKTLLHGLLAASVFSSPLSAMDQQPEKTLKVSRKALKRALINGPTWTQNKLISVETLGDFIDLSRQSMEKKSEIRVKETPLVSRSSTNEFYFMNNQLKVKILRVRSLVVSPKVAEAVASHVQLLSDLLSWALVCKASSKSANEILQNKLFIVGDIASGKSTLMHLLTNNKLTSEESWENIVLSAETPLPGIKISHGMNKKAGELPLLDHRRKCLLVKGPNLNLGNYKTGEDHKTVIQTFEKELFNSPGKRGIVFVTTPNGFESDRNPNMMKVWDHLVQMFPKGSQWKEHSYLIFNKTKQSYNPMSALVPHIDPTIYTGLTVGRSSQTIDVVNFFMFSPAHCTYVEAPTKVGPYVMCQRLREWMDNITLASFSPQPENK